MHGVGKQDFLIRRQGIHQRLLSVDKCLLLFWISLCAKRYGLFVLEPQTPHQFFGSRSAIVLAILDQDIGTDFIGIADWMLGEVLLPE